MVIYNRPMHDSVLVCLTPFDPEQKSVSEICHIALILGLSESNIASLMPFKCPSVPCSCFLKLRLLLKPSKRRWSVLEN